MEEMLVAASRSPRQGSRGSCMAMGLGGPGQWGAEGLWSVPLCWDCSGTPETRPVRDPSSPTSTRSLRGTPCQRREPVGTEPTAQGATGPEKPGHLSASPPSRPLPRGRERGLCFGGFCQQGDLPAVAGPRTALGPTHTLGGSPASPLCPSRAVRAVCHVGRAGAPSALTRTGNRHPSDTSGKAHWNSDLRAENPQMGGGSCGSSFPNPIQTPPGPRVPTGLLHLGQLEARAVLRPQRGQPRRPRRPRPPARVQTALTARRWRRRRGVSSGQRTPKADTGSGQDSFIGHREPRLPPAGWRLRPRSLLPETLSLPPLESLYLQGLQEGWEQGEGLRSGLEFIRFSFYFPEVELGRALPGGAAHGPCGVSGAPEGVGGPGRCRPEAVGANASATPRGGPLSPAPCPAAPRGSGSTAPGPLPRAPTSMMFSRSTLEATLNSGALWRYRPSVTSKRGAREPEGAAGQPRAHPLTAPCLALRRSWVRQGAWPRSRPRPRIPPGALQHPAGYPACPPARGPQFCP